MVYNLRFAHGGYNGSSLCLLGAGGTGVFRFARGYAVAKRIVLDFKAQLVVRELNVYVSHY
ncbi:unnamed protein product [Linum tenue]|uniref:Dirigent protein n=1 Tax=Linum tenue TaxID=586396 RepID=A0AAV0JCJ9_9ROSI|nr:unnamed protein product [Linum tenue]